MKFKKIIALGVTLLSVMGVVGCATNNENGGDNNPDINNPDENGGEENNGSDIDISKLKQTTIKETRGSQGSYDDYYEPVRGLKGAELKAGLHEIIKGHKEFAYGGQATKDLRVIDADPHNKNNIIIYYQGSEPKNYSFNKEHVWAKGNGGFGTTTGIGSDYHNLHACDFDLNSARSSLEFGETNGKDASEYGWGTPNMKGNKVGGNLFEPKDSFKGDTARTLFYMATRYESEDRWNLEVSAGPTCNPIDTSLYNTFGPGQHGDFTYLYEWATSGIDPVDDIEVNRNNIIDSKYQHNRNPFIDHPEFLIMIYDKNYDGPGALNDK